MFKKRLDKPSDTPAIAKFSHNGEALASKGVKTRTYPTRGVKCQICPYTKQRFFGRGLLVKPCPDCGSRMTFAQPWLGDFPVTPDPKLVLKAAA
jgi:hypothetical protein